ncbi:hypothetical protein HDV04_005253 [Boothiomyces sp. JEL0838]|nr:hypothetical protein HDV04_005253 [Boothiomyces sp. JEL0838]
MWLDILAFDIPSTILVHSEVAPNWELESSNPKNSTKQRMANKSDAERLFVELKPMLDKIYHRIGSKNKYDYNPYAYLESRKASEERYKGDEQMDNFMSHFKFIYSLKNFDIVEILESNPRNPELAELLKEDVNMELWCLHHKELKEQLHSIPKWVDLERVNRAKVFHWKHYPFIALALTYLSLQMNYVSPSIGSTLAKTGYLASPKIVFRRLVETTKFIFDCIISEDSLSVNSDGWKGIVRVRCLHSSVRARLRARIKEAEEVFVNQDEMCFTLVTFGFHSLVGMAHLGIRFSKQEMEDYFHLWRYIGYLLGVREDINPLALPVEDVVDEVLSSFSTFQMKNVSPRLARALHECLPYSKELSMAFAQRLNPPIIYEAFELDHISKGRVFHMHVVLFLVRIMYLPIYWIICIYSPFAYVFGSNVLRLMIKYYLPEDSNFNPVTIANASDSATCPITGKSREDSSCPVTGDTGN